MVMRMSVLYRKCNMLYHLEILCYDDNTTLHPKSPLKICGIWIKFQILTYFSKSVRIWLKFQILTNFSKSENLAQIPHIFQLMKKCCGVNKKHPSAESRIWNLAFKHHRKIWNFTRLLLVKFQRMFLLYSENIVILILATFGLSWSCKQLQLFNLVLLYFWWINTGDH